MRIYTLQVGHTIPRVYLSCQVVVRIQVMTLPPKFTTFESATLTRRVTSRLRSSLYWLVSLGNILSDRMPVKDGWRLLLILWKNSRPITILSTEPKKIGKRHFFILLWYAYHWDSDGNKTLGFSCPHDFTGFASHFVRCGSNSSHFLLY